MSWILAFLGFAALIILHEAGHFAAAKAVGMRVERFALFFPPLLGRVRRGETEYAIGAVPPASAASRARRRQGNASRSGGSNVSEPTAARSSAGTGTSTRSGWCSA